MEAIMRQLIRKNELAHILMRSNSIDRAVFLFIFIIAISSKVNAAVWELNPALGLAESFTDNVRLADEGAEESDWITEIVPSITFRGNSPIFSTSGSYKAQGVIYSENDVSNDVYHQLDARINTKVVDDFLYFDVNGLYTQRVIDPDVSLPPDNLAITTNTTDVGSYTLSPYIQTKLSQIHTAFLRYRYEKIDNLGEGLLDSTNRRVNANVGNTLARSDLGWNINYENIDSREVGGTIWKYDRSAIDLDYAISANTVLLATGGYEHSEYEQANTLDQGAFWNAGILFGQNARTQMTLKLGRRYYGKTGLFSFVHSTRYWQWNISYSEDLQNSDTLLLSRVGITEPGDPITSPTDPGVSTGVFLNKAFNLSATYEKGKTSIDMNLYDEEREYQVSEVRESDSGGSLNWRWRFLPRTELNFVASVLKSVPRGFESSNYTTTYKGGINRTISQYSRLAFEYRFLERDAETTGDSYKQNLYTLRYTLTL